MQPVSEKKIKELQIFAEYIREDIIRMTYEAKSGHPGGALGMADIFSALYFHILRFDVKRPLWEDRDRLVLSNGHICPVLYAALARAGYFKREELLTLRKINSRLQGHPHRGSLPGVETSSGPLGSGLSQSIGMALAAKLNKQNHRIFCVLSDGEHDEGNTWEAILFAAKQRLNNLTVIVDRNNIQIDGPTEKILPLKNLGAKYQAFGWHVLGVEGSGIEGFVHAVTEAESVHEGPTVIIAHTVPGKGVQFMENKYEWHGKAPNEKEMNLACEEIIARRKLLQKDA
jgi:transketolase